MSFLELWNVSKTYGTGPAEVQALENIDVSVDRGALVAVMGPSGSGKSTLLTIAGSLEEPSSGEVMIGGAALTKTSRAIAGAETRMTAERARQEDGPRE